MVWSSEDKGNNIRIREISRVEFFGCEDLDNLIRTNESISFSNFPFYCEFKVIECGENGENTRKPEIQLGIKYLNSIR